MRANTTVDFLNNLDIVIDAVALNARWAWVNDGGCAYFLDCRSVDKGDMDALGRDLASDDPEEHSNAYSLWCAGTTARHENEVPARVRAEARREGLARRGEPLTWGW